MDCSPPGSSVIRGLSRQENRSGWRCPPLGTRIEPRSLALQVDSLPSNIKGKPKNTGVDSLSLLQGIFLTEESHQCLLNCRQILYQHSTRESKNNDQLESFQFVFGIEYMHSLVKMKIP